MIALAGATLGNRALGILGLLVALLASHGVAYHRGNKNGTNAVLVASQQQALATQQDKLTALAATRDIEQARYTQLEEALTHANQQRQRLDAAATFARTELGRVRSDLSTLRSQLPSLTEAAVRRYADAASAVFGECAAAYTGLAATADALDLDRSTVMAAWPRQ
jgi:cell division protein FtsB